MYIVIFPPEDRISDHRMQSRNSTAEHLPWLVDLPLLVCDMDMIMSEHLSSGSACRTQCSLDFLVNGNSVTLPPLGPPRIRQLLRTISLYGRWSTRGSDRGIAHFFTATRIQSREREKKNKRTKRTICLGLTQVQKESYVTLCMCRLTLVWILAKLLQSYWNADSSWPGLISLMPTGLSARVSTGHSRHPSPTANFSSSFFQLCDWCSLTTSGHPRSRVQNPLSGFVPKQTKESSVWRITYIVLQFNLCIYLNFLHRIRGVQNYF